MLFVLKLIKNGVNEIIEEGTPAVPSASAVAAGQNQRRHSGRRTSKSEAGAKGGSDNTARDGEGDQAEAEAEESEEESLEAAMKDLRMCMDLVMKRLVIGQSSPLSIISHSL